MIITLSFVQKAALALALTATAGTALAQTSPLKAGPMPADMPKLGDKDAVCFLASAMAASSIQSAIEKLPPEQRDGVLELSRRQMAFYIGKVSTRFPEPQAASQVTATSSSFAADAKADRRPIMKWCLATYSEDVNAFQAKVTDARKLAEKTDPKVSAIQASAVDEDALCFALVGVALPQTMEAAKTNPKAANGVKVLGRAQHFYMGRLLAKPHKVSIEQSIADAWSYTAALSRANDNATANAKVNACAAKLEQISPGYFQAALKGLPEGR